MKTLILFTVATLALCAILPAAEIFLGRPFPTNRAVTVQEAMERSGLPYAQVESIVSTNWLALSLEKASGTGPTVSEPKQIGILISNRYAVVVADNATNRILLSSQAVLPRKLLLRDPPPLTLLTNTFRWPAQNIYITNW